MSLSSQKLRPVVSLDLTIDTKLDESIHCHTCCMNTNSTQSQSNPPVQKCEASTQTMNTDVLVNLSVCSGGGGSSSTSSINSVLKNKRYNYLMHHQLTRDSGIDSDHQQHHQQQKIKQETPSLIKMSSSMNRKQQMSINAQQQQQHNSRIEDYVQQDCNDDDEDDDEEDDDNEDEDEKQKLKTYHTSSTRDNSPEDPNSLDQITNDVVMQMFNKNVIDEDNVGDLNDNHDRYSGQDSFKKSPARSFASMNESALKKRLSFKSILTYVLIKYKTI
jgi:hypothetical protein